MKKLSVFLITFILLMITGACVYAAEFNVDNLSLPDGEAYKPYNAQINMVGGNDGYTFEFDSGMKPAGIAINSDGSIAGTPSSAGYYTNINIRISHIGGTSAIKSFSLYISPKKIKVNITAPDNIIYDGNEYTADCQCFDSDTGELVDNVIPKILYGVNNEPKVTDAGIYYINVTSPSGCTITERTGDDYIVINPAEASISVTDKIVPYDGNPHPVTEDNISVNPSIAGYQVEYRKKGESEYTTVAPSSSGIYDVRVHTTNPNYITAYDTAKLEITPELVNFTVTNNSVVYDGKVHTATVTADKENIEYNVKYKNEHGEEVESPTEAGKYTIEITLVNNDAYAVGTISSDTLTILKQNVVFTVDKDSWDYDGVEHTPIITTNPSIDESFYTVSYKKQNSDEILTSIKDIGIYDVIINLNNSNYEIDNDSSKVITVKGMTVSFNVTDNVIEYDGERHSATITTVPEIDSKAYTVSYRKNGSQDELNDVVDAGTYDIIISLNDDNYTIGNISSSIMTVNHKIMNFVISNNEVNYTGEAQTATINPEDPNFDQYTVSYQQQGTAITSPNVINAGVYDIIITFTNPNYVLPNDFSAIMTVNAQVYMNNGNSPAAMIYKDTTKDEQWKKSAFEYFKANHSFNDIYLPENCKAGITYNTINNLDLDADISTVIVKNIDDFVDPGLVVNDGITDLPIIGNVTAVDGVEGLYKCTYSYNGQNYERYIIEVGAKIGDVNSDGNVNAIDANYLDKMNNVKITNVTEARIYDVDKNGVLNGDDADAIRNRFRNPLVPYYPWL